MENEWVLIILVNKGYGFFLNGYKVMNTQIIWICTLFINAQQYFYLDIDNDIWITIYVDKYDKRQDIFISVTHNTAYITYKLNT